MNYQKHTIQSIQKLKKQKQHFAVVTAYDFPTAQIIDELDFPIVLVGDSAAMVVYGYNNTTQITMDEMLLISKAVARGTKKTMIVGDMPFMSYQPSVELAVKNAGRFIKEGKVDAIKLEGGVEYIEQISEIIKAGIPVMGHIGLKPQSILIESGYKIHGKTTESALKIYKDAIALEKAGVFSVVLEGVPLELAELITNKLKIPTIGIGAGHLCDAQIQVLYDIIGLLGENVPKHAYPYIHNKQIIKDALIKYQHDVVNKKFLKRVYAKKMDTIELTQLKDAIENI